MTTITPVQNRFLYEVANEIKSDWPNANDPHDPAGHYVKAMGELRYITDDYYADDARTVVLYFLSNARSWRGPVAQRVKKELKALCGLR